MRLVQSGRMTVATDYSYPPFAFRAPDGDLVGFDVDIAKAVADEMKLEATFVNRNLVPDLETFIVGVASKDDLEAKLATALASAKSRVLRRYQIGVAADPQRRFPLPPTVSNVPDQS